MRENIGYNELKLYVSRSTLLQGNNCVEVRTHFQQTPAEASIRKKYKKVKFLKKNSNERRILIV